MIVAVNQARHHRAAGNVHYPRSLGYYRCRPGGGDAPVVAYQHRCARNRWPARPVD